MIVECPIERWLRREDTCYECDGIGDVLHPTLPRQKCKTCNGTRRVEGLGIRMTRAYPIGKVYPIDRRPIASRKGWNGKIAYDWVKYSTSEFAFDEEWSIISDPVFLLIVNNNERTRTARFNSPEDAMESLSLALVEMVRTYIGREELPIRPYHFLR